MDEIIKHINDTNASFRMPNAGDAKNTDLFLDNEHYELFKDAGEQITVRFSKENISKAILFIASILPRKYDNSSIHKLVKYSPEFVYEQLALLDCFFKDDGVPVDKKTQKWNVRKDVLKKNGEVDNRFYFNGLLEDVEYINYKGERASSKFTIRNYVAGGYSNLHIKKADDGIFDVWITNVQQPYFDNMEDCKEVIDDNILQIFPLQTIYYGAPGTGKSHEVKELTEAIYRDKDEREKFVFRTTFHPDYDYASFVGCYKPIKEDDKITYSFVPQVFTNAYVKAWSNPDKPVYLVIEEINRGNCAQIFGDLFQLLDRDDKTGFSTYPIKPDTDLGNYIKEEFEKAGVNSAVFPTVFSGEELILPPNLNLLATMNTSDQSLFPMDSAFKRRWDWEFVPIRYSEAEAKDDNENFYTFTITIGNKEKGNEKTYLWTEFLKKVNEKILSVTDSEDKQMGEYFIKKNVDEKTFINKVMYYLWSEVGKDMYNTTNAFFELPQDFEIDGKEQKQFSFNELFQANATALLEGFMEKLEVKSEEE